VKIALRNLLRSTILAFALAGPFPAVALAALPSVAGKKLLFVVLMDGRGRQVDDKVKEHLESLGLSVTMVDQVEPATRADGHDVVLISASVTSALLEGAYRHTQVPLVTYESHILDDLGMTGKREDRDFGTEKKERHLWMVNAPHALSAGFPAGALNVYTGGTLMNWGKPGLGAIIIATLPGQPEKSAIFAYEKGATMDHESLAPARRVSFFLENETFLKLNEAGLKLFDAAIRWAVGKPCE